METEVYYLSDSEGSYDGDEAFILVDREPDSPTAMMPPSSSFKPKKENLIQKRSRRIRDSIESMEFMSSINLWGANKGLLKKITMMMWECPKFEQRETSLMAFGSSQKFVLKMMPMTKLHFLFAEAQFCSKLEESRDQFGSMLLKFHGLVLVDHSELLRAVSLHSDINTIKRISSLKSDAFAKLSGPFLIGILVTDFAENACTLLEYMVQRRLEAQEAVYGAEFDYIQAKITNFLAQLDALIPGARHNDLKPDNVLVKWSRAPDKINFNLWRRETISHWVNNAKDSKTTKAYFIPHPPEFEIYVIDFGLAWYPGGTDVHIADKNMGFHGIGPCPNSIYDPHTFYNTIRDCLISHPDIGGEAGLFRPEVKFLNALKGIFGEHALGFGMSFRCSQETSGRGGPLVYPQGKGSQPLVEGRLSLAPTLFEIRHGEQERRVQAAAVLAFCRDDCETFAKYMKPSCPREMIKDLMSRRIDRVLKACSYLNYKGDFPGTAEILEKNLLRLNNLKTV